MAANPGLNVDWYPATLPAGTGIHLQTVVTVDGNAAKGTLYTPPGREPRETTVVVLMHPRVDFSRHYLIPALVGAGDAVYVQQSRDAGNDLRLVHEQALLDLGAGLEWLHTVGFRRTVGLGNSGGGGLLTYYVQQSQRAPSDRITRTPAGRPSALDRATLPMLDALAYLAPHPGQGTLLGHCIDPSVTDEDDPFSVDPALDPFAEHNGYRPAPDSSSYPPGFVERYRAAQLDRVARIDERARAHVAEARDARTRVKAGGATPDDRRRAGTARLITVWRTDADLRAMDLGLDKSDRGYGSVIGPRPEVTNYGIAGFGRLTTPDAWLSTWSAHTSNATIARTGPDMTLPALLVSYTADNCVFPGDVDRIVDTIASSDLQVHAIAADHYGNPVDPGDRRRDRAAGIIAEWMRDL
ncbi:alpha/beta hydrolase [Pseudonocardia sp. C8]|uniref:alpha/beta hydrolase n=1 Tax=Pseudonocardia sp. C8 TaxID=2762759 RepID=UPI0016428095|nr:alpha/beta hydrolase [Pseudonocardia sp. C8]MBC3191274.1 alpha/beta hydrolase [Pseudonocardia sp. C8]